MQFFTDLFEAYPPDDNQWKYYEQKAIKVCVIYTNTTKVARPMLEYRSGFDGKTEIDPKTGKPKLLQPGDTRYIAIEPSSKKFKYDQTKQWGSAAYPKDIESAAKVWVPLKPQEVVDTLKVISQKRLVIPYYQIADTIVRLYGDKYGDTKSLSAHIRQCMEAGDIKGLPDAVSIVRSNARVLGRLVTGGFKHKIFPMGYGEVPIKRGCMIVIDLTEKLDLKDTTTKYTIDGQTYTTPITVRIIDGPAVKGAMWTEMEVAEYRQKRVKTLIQKAIRMISTSQ